MSDVASRPAIIVCVVSRQGRNDHIVGCIVDISLLQKDAALHYLQEYGIRCDDLLESRDIGLNVVYLEHVLGGG
jgi:hypothetical protein